MGSNLKQTPSPGSLSVVMPTLGKKWYKSLAICRENGESQGVALGALVHETIHVLVQEEQSIYLTIMLVTLEVGRGKGSTTS